MRENTEIVAKIEQVEKVVLLDENLQPIGEVEKSKVHSLDTPLHLAFSCFLFRRNSVVAKEIEGGEVSSELSGGGGELLVQQRALHKVTWPGVWSNSCCGHPMPGEEMKEAVYRRLKYELGIERSEVEVKEILPDFRYKAEKDGVVENEFCPVWIGFIEKEPNPNPLEVNAVDYINWQEFVDCLKDPECKKFDHFSVWCKEEALLLDESGKVEELLKQNGYEN